MSSGRETDEWLAFAHELADAARGILLTAMGEERVVSIKHDSSMVTEADKAIETRMRAMIEDRYPGHGILGEEHGSRDVDAPLVWVLDPIDGTAPFVAGIPVYGTLIGLAREGRPFLGIIDHPATDDRWAGGLTLGVTLNGQPVGTRACADLSEALMTNSNPDFFDASQRRRFDRLRARVRYTQYGGSCYAYGVLASGRTDLGVDAGLDPFDIFAPAAIVEGAGGLVTDWGGQPITLDWSGQVVAAGDPATHAAARAVLE